jgi:dipeptidyl aminopeptidase/acylaminoacyl peptidase
MTTQPRPPAVSAVDYARAERFLPRRVWERISFGAADPYWLGEHCFWYLRRTPGHKEFVLVDAGGRSRRPPFDHAALAAALSTATGNVYSAGALPFDTFAYAEEGGAIEFEAAGTTWHYTLGSNVLERRHRAASVASELPSPDGKWTAFLREGNLYVRELETGNERQLTDDAEPLYDYAGSPEGRTSTVSEAVLGVQRPPVALWSPDSKRLLTHRLDQREVGSLHLIQSVPPEGVRPVLHSFRFALACEERVPLATCLVFDMESGSATVLEGRPRPADYRTPIEWGEMWWSEAGQSILVLERSRDSRVWTVLRADAATGKTRELFREESESSTYPRATMVSVLNVRELSNGDLIWYSYRDGWGHLYRYDANGVLKAQLTSGAWAVHEILHVDEEHGVLYCAGGGREPGRDPYLRHMYRVELDGSGVALLTPEDADHAAIFSPCGRYFVDHFSRVDTIPVTVLRTVDGGVVMELEDADISALVADGWHGLERFTVKSADGAYDLYGVVYLPSRIDAGCSYPLIEYIYPGPQRTATPKSLDDAWQHDCQALAELGFAVMMFDARGTPYRSKALLDTVYGAGFGRTEWLADHVRAIRELGKRYPFIDTERVGIFGISAGGFAAARAILTYPDIFDVAISIAGNHDQRGYLPIWGETYLGLDEAKWREQSTLDLAANLKGKLLLMHGEMDDNCHPSQTMRLVDALIAANKDFDLLILPNCNHILYDLRCGWGTSATGRRNPYALRRIWDYFVRHLLDAEPPAGYQIGD